MKFRKLIAAICVATLGVAITAITTIALAEPSKDAKGAAPEMPLPPGWTKQDMQACMDAGTPGEQHKRLAQSVGTWHGRNTGWMYPGASPMQSESKFVITP